MSIKLKSFTSLNNLNLNGAAFVRFTVDEDNARYNGTFYTVTVGDVTFKVGTGYPVGGTVLQVVQDASDEWTYTVLNTTVKDFIFLNGDCNVSTLNSFFSYLEDVLGVTPTSVDGDDAYLEALEQYDEYQEYDDEDDAGYHGYDELLDALVNY